MRIYLDVCCFSRPFDKQTQHKIHFETEAILTILQYCKIEIWTLVTSAIVDLEISKNPNLEMQRKVKALRSCAKEHVPLNESTEKRAIELEVMGFKFMDASHLACAEEANVDVLLTTDEKFLKKASRETDKIKIKVANPLQWLIEKGEMENGITNNDNE